ncbi:hypothetical protein [Mucilaginibacter dorajii]|uniref:Uncharacterized protein n=1 Tax=Mucilaginibacter dorajii TaxID=692994 RepID=A0ABP7QQP8_9SPHI|nr:hypothetical protein [Mucilaginibacter dorajii]MCS3733950.1 hypothetical protein [Mucilaginibacter dorajii]
MKINLYLVALTALMASCTGNISSDSNDTSDIKISPGDTQLTSAPGSPAVNMQYCFFHTDGTQAQDTTKVSMLINGDKVTGNMQWLPKEKDARKGTLTGTLNGNAIKALWTFNQEGRADTMSVEFQLRGNALAQKPYKYDTKTDKEQTNAASDYKVIYNMTNCK